MRLKHPDYITLVKGTYKKKLANNELSQLLIQSTPGNIRQECVNVFKERYENRDAQAIRAFFGPAENNKEYLALIHDFSLNRFKALDRYLKSNGKKGINSKNLNLLAWLIDFNYRPYSYGMEVILSEEELAIINGEEYKAPVDQPFSVQNKPNNEKETEKPEESPNEAIPVEALAASGAGAPVLPVVSPVKEKDRKPMKRAVLILLVLVLGGGGLYTLWELGGKNLVKDIGGSGCMYWANDHYEKVDCNEAARGRLILPLNEEKLLYFKKITRPDTITERSVGKLYYMQTNKQHEFFTMEGNHPVYINRKLRVLSGYMFEKYLEKKAGTIPDSLAVQNSASKVNR